MTRLVVMVVGWNCTFSYLWLFYNIAENLILILMEETPLCALLFCFLLYFCKSHVLEFSTCICVGVDADGAPVNGSDDGGVCYPNLPICLPCWPGCKSCQDGAPCWVQEAWLLRASVLAVQGVFMLLIFVSMLVAYRHRRNRVSQVLLAQEQQPWCTLWKILLFI